MANRTASLIAKLVDEVSGPARGMAGALKGTTAALDALKSKAGKIDAFKNASRSLDDASQRFKVAQQNVRRLTTEMAAADGSGKKLGGALAKAKNEAEAAGAAFQRQGAKVREMRTAMEQAGVPLNKLRAYERDLKVQTEQATAALKRQQAVARIGTGPSAGRASRRSLIDVGGSQELTSRMRRNGRPARTLGPLGGAIGAYGVAQGFKDAAKFDRRLTMIGQTADAGRAEIDAMGGSIFRLAQETAVPVDKITGGLESLVAQGRSLKEGLEFLPSVARTAAASGSEVEDIAKTADSVGSNFNIAGKQMQTAFDIMAAGGKAGQFELKDMSRYLPSLAPAAKAVGFQTEKGLADVVSMLQVLRKGSGSSEEAATSLTNIFNKMESEETAKKFKKMGVDLEAAFKKGRKEGRNLVEVFEEAAQQATKGDLSKLPNLIADQEFARGVRALLTYKGEWQKLSATIQSTSGGTVMRDIVQVTKDSQAAVDRLSNSFEQFKLSAARAAESVGASSDLGKFGAELQDIATAMERINGAYKEGGLSGALKQAAGDISERFQENKKAYLDKDREDQVARIAEMEEGIANTRKSLAKKGYSQDRIDGTVRSQEMQLKAERRALDNIIVNRAAMETVPKTPLRMGVDPTAPIQGQPGAITPGTASFQQAYPLDTSGSKPLPSATPLPPSRPGNLPRGIDSINDVLGPGAAPKIDVSSIEAVKPKADEAKAAVESLNVTATPNVVATSILTALEYAKQLNAELAKIPGGAATGGAAVKAMPSPNAGGGNRTGKVSSALSGAYTSQGMG